MTILHRITNHYGSVCMKEENKEKVKLKKCRNNKQSSFSLKKKKQSSFIVGYMNKMTSVLYQKLYIYLTH